MLSAGSNKVALIVDDEAFARIFAVQVLLDEGFVVLEAPDAAEGLEALERNDDVGVLFTDISMPGMDGLELVRRVRERRPEIILVLTSGRVAPAPDEVPEGVRFLAKPYTARLLLESLRGPEPS